ncbi:hypothetical protein EG68_10845 [Paragonimus skrjabini miyazakii]|uniref:RRM domain-containing protein n=1 Tax=Paragonimus skrjabini miyazakii TaxID=59628 RepID=A0A8S9YIR1_9TREM|nr:hypothetical protein EG68_10845 [Paragonimus skrjabini miyazakii]
MCILQFNTPYECQRVYAECQEGKEVAGRVLHVEFGGNLGQNPAPPRNPSYPSAGSYDRQPVSAQYGSDERRDRPNPVQRTQNRDYQQHGSNKAEGGSTLTVSNLPYTATERDIRREFPEAFRVVLTLDERGRSRGVAQLSFPTSDECNAALHACNYKTLNGRPVRGRIVREHDDAQFEQHGNGQRDFDSRRGRQSEQNPDRRDRDSYNSNRFQPGGGRGGGNRFGGRDFNRDNRPDTYNQRRDRSPVRGEPVRGYGSSKGPRITSAVIHRPGGNQSASSSSSDEN